jgi:cell division protease FtsH
VAGKILRWGGVIIVIAIAPIVLFNLNAAPTGRTKQAILAFSDFITDVGRGQVADVMIAGRNIAGHFTDGRSFSTYAPDMPELTGRLIGNNVRLTAAPADDTPSGIAIIVPWLPLVLWLLALWYFVTRPLHKTIAALKDIGRTLDQIAQRPGSVVAPLPRDR